jgi:hypothetical protein
MRNHLAATIVFAQLHLGNPGVQEGDYSDGLLGKT